MSLERFNDADHFGSIVRSFWFSIVTVTTIGYGDVTPPTTLGKSLAVAFGILGIICIALLTANILDANGRFDSPWPLVLMLLMSIRPSADVAISFSLHLPELQLLFYRQA